MEEVVVKYHYISGVPKQTVVTLNWFGSKLGVHKELIKKESCHLRC